MLEFSDKPYRFFPPHRVGFLARLLTLYNRYRYLTRRCRVHAVTTEIDPDTQRLADARARTLFVPNHPTHADAYVYMEAIHRLGRSTLTLSAYDVFLRSKLNARIMQTMGCFSVDREGSDPQSMRCALDTLTAGRHALTIFAEGNVYLTNDRLTPLHDGSAMLAVRAVKALDPPESLHVVPVSIKYSHLQDASADVMDRLESLAQHIGVPWDTTRPPIDRLRAVAVAALHHNLTQLGFDTPEENDLGALVAAAALAVLTPLETSLQLQPRPDDTLTDRVRRCRRVIHQIRLDDDQADTHNQAIHWADQAMLAYRILTYTPGYVADHPTLDRFAETVEKLAEDLHSTEQPALAPRAAVVRFNAPIDVRALLDARRGKSKQAIGDLTTQIESAIQLGLDDLAARNPHPGGSILLT